MKVWILRYADWENQNIIGITSKKEEIEKFKKDYPDLSDYTFESITIAEYDLENSLFSQDYVKKIIKEYEEAKEEELRRRKQEEEDG